MDEKCFSWNLTTFSGQVPQEHAKLKTGPRWLDFTPETYPHSLWCSFYCFPFVWLKNVLVEFWILFRRVDKVENRVRMTQFFTRNIPILFLVQFLLFLISMTKKCFGRILTTFMNWVPPEQAKLKIAPVWLDFALEIHPHYLGCISYHFQSLWLKNVSVKFSILFRVRAPPEQEKLKTGTHMTRCCARIIPTLFGVQFVSFPISTAEKWFGQIFMTFLGTGTTRACSKQAKFIVGPGLPGFAPKTYPHCFGCNSYRLPSVRLKMFGSNFDDFFGPVPHQSMQKLKIRPSWLGFSPETYPHSLWFSSYRFPLIQLKNVSVEFWRLFRAAKLKIGPRWLGFAPETYPHYFGCNSYCFPLVRLKNVSVQFWRLFRARAPPERAKLKTGPKWFGFAPETYPHSLWSS